MQKNISCFEVLEELYEENTDNKNLEQIVFDISLLKKYLCYYQKYKLLKEIEDVVLPRKLRGHTDGGFIEDYTSKDEIKEGSSVATKVTTKFILSLVFQETRSEKETIKDMLMGDVEAFFEDKEEELARMLLSPKDKKLIKGCFDNVKTYEKINSYPRYGIFKLSSRRLNMMKLCLLKFQMYLDDKNNWDMDYQQLESYLNRENFLDMLEELTYKVVSSNSKTEVQINLIGISSLLAKLRMGITKSIALQTREITKDKGRKNLLDISTKMNLNELSEETQKLEEELKKLLSPLLNSQFIQHRLYKFFFERRGDLTI